MIWAPPPAPLPVRATPAPRPAPRRSPRALSRPSAGRRRLHASRPVHPGQHDTRDRRGRGLHLQVPADQGADERAAAADLQPEPAGAAGRTL